MTDALRGCPGRVAIVECGDGALLDPLVGLGLDVYGVEPRAAVADAALRAGSKSASTTAPRTCTRSDAAALGGLVLRGIVERGALGELLLLIDAAAAKLAPGGRLVVCSLRRDAWGASGNRGRSRPRRGAPAASRHVARSAPRAGIRRRGGPRCGRRRLRRHRDPRRRMTAVHQFVPTLAPRDAAGSHYLAVQQTLRDAGYRSDIYSYEAKEEYKRLAHPFASFTGAARGEPTWLLYHSSVGSPVADFVAARDEPLIVDYHNITPAPFFARWEPAVAAALMKGRRQLATLEPQCRAGHRPLRVQRAGAQRARLRADIGGVRSSWISTCSTSTPAEPATLGRLADARAGGGLDWLFVGRLAPNKAQHDLVKAFAVYRRLFDPKARLHLVGASSSHLYETALLRLRRSARPRRRGRDHRRRQRGRADRVLRNPPTST